MSTLLLGARRSASPASPVVSRASGVSNWRIGEAREFGARIFRQKLGRARPRKSNAAHKFMDAAAREAFCASLK